MKTIHLANPLRISVLSGKTFFLALNSLPSGMFMQCKHNSLLLPLINRENGDCLPLVEDGTGKMNKGAREVLFPLLRYIKEASSSIFQFFSFLFPSYFRKGNSFELKEE